MARELEPGRKLACHRGSFLEGPTGLGRARQQACQAACMTSPTKAPRPPGRNRARLSFHKVGAASHHVEDHHDRGHVVRHTPLSAAAAAASDRH